jgi:hypothetical protein
LSQKRQFFRKFFGENISKILTSVPDRIQLDSSSANLLGSDAQETDRNGDDQVKRIAAGGGPILQF